MNLPLPLDKAIIAVLCSALVIFFTRSISFIVFKNGNPPPVIRFIEKYMPAVIMAILLVYCFKDVEFSHSPFGAPYIICTVFCAAVHLLFNNSMLSIVGSTVLFMVLSRIM
ncbi:MAG: AzlD domain-containing protein [Treponema sp.]|nr:AzlD domain-containing protein [Treponema sp.]